MYFKVTDGNQLIQFYAEDDKDAKKKLKEYGTSFKFLKDDVNYNSILFNIGKLSKDLSTSKKALSGKLKPTLEEQEAKDFLLSKSTLLCPLLSLKYKGKELDTKCEELLQSLASRVSSIAKELEVIDGKLTLLQELKKKVLTNPEECIKLLETFKE